jgi:hypothetical protein
VATLTLFGWTLPLLPSGNGFKVGLPTATHTGDLYWDPGHFIVSEFDNTWWLRAAPALAIRLDGLTFRLRIERLPLVRNGENFRPHSAQAASAVQIRMGPDNGTTSRVRVGPVVLDGEGSNAIFFEAADPSGRPSFRSDMDWSFEGPNAQPGPVPVSVKFAAQKFMKIDLAARRLVIERGTVAARLSSGRTTSAADQTALFLNDGEVWIPFSAMADGRVEHLSLAFAMAPGSAPVPLNVDARSGKPGVEAIAAGLTLRLSPISGAGTALPRSAISSAALKAPQGGLIRLRFNGLRNSKNLPEEWGTWDPVPLGFRRPDGEGWRSALILPSQGDGAELRRLNGTVGRGSAERHLPMHSWFGNSQVILSADSRARLVCTPDAAEPLGAQSYSIDKSLLWNTTRPWLRLRSVEFRQGRPGDAYHGASAAAVWRFRPQGSVAGGGVPALGFAAWSRTSANPGGGDPLAEANRQVDASFASMALVQSNARHETGLQDASTTTPRLKAVVPAAERKAGEVDLGSHDRLFKLAPPVSLPARSGQTGLSLDVAFSVPEGQSADYAIYWPSGAATLPKIPDIRAWGPLLDVVIDPIAPLRLMGTQPDANWPSTFPLALLKLSRRRDLRDILKEIRATVADPAAFDRLLDGSPDAILPAIQETDPDILSPDWVGLLLFNAPIDFSGFAALQALVPTAPEIAPRFKFFSVSPRDPGQPRNVAISAGVAWRNPQLGPGTAPTGTEEATLQPVDLKVGFRDRRVVRFHSRAQLRFYSFFGVEGTSGGGGAKWTEISILGSVQQTKNATGGSAQEIRFAAEMKANEKLVVYPAGTGVPQSHDQFFVKKGWLRRLEVVERTLDGGKHEAEIQIDGAIEFQRPNIQLNTQFAEFFNTLREVSFGNLRISLSKLTGLDARGLKLHYPSLKFDLNLPHVGLLGDALRMKFHQLALDWATPDLPRFNTVDFMDLGFGLPKLNPNLPKIVFLGRVDFGKLPDIFARKLSGFALECAFGFNFQSGRLIGSPFVGVRGFGFSGLNLDLASFITVKIKKLELGRKDWPGGRKGAAVSLCDGELSILKFKVLEKLSGGYFSLDNEGGSGFWALLKTPETTGELLRFHWGFAAQNVDFPSSIAKELLAPPPPEGEPNDVTGRHGALYDAWKTGELAPAAGRGGRGWTFAASIGVLADSFVGRALFQDGGFMGLALSGPGMKELLGWEFGFIGIYRKDITPGEDYFYFSVTLPKFTMGTFRFMGGQIAVELFTSGDFMVDFGFPWPVRGGGRQWERTLGVIVTPGQASGGWYVRKRQHMVPQTDNASAHKLLVIAAGIAVQWGLGATFGKGRVFTVWVRIGVYAILEGELTLRLVNSISPRIVAFHVKGAAGILLEGAGEIDWWVINVRVGVRASAEVRTAILWKEGGPVQMQLGAELHVSAYARACIGPRWARVCKSIDVSLTIPVRHKLTFG